MTKEKTKLVKAANGKDTLRATVPMFCVRQWDLEAGEELEWSIEKVKGEV